MTVSALRALARADSRLLWRDPLLGWVLVMPVGLAMLSVLVAFRDRVPCLRRRHPTDHAPG